MNWDPAALNKRTHRRTAYMYFAVAALIFMFPLAIKLELSYGGGPRKVGEPPSSAPAPQYQSGGEFLARQHRLLEDDRRVADVMQRFYGTVEFFIAWLLVSGVFLSPLISRGRRHLATSAIYDPLVVGAPYALYLRPFSSSGGDYSDRELDALPTAFRGSMRRCRSRVGSRAVQELRRQTSRKPSFSIRRRITKTIGRHSFVSVSDPSGGLAGDTGAVALNERWREDVSELMRGAHLVVLALGGSEGVLWEFRQLMDSYRWKALVLLPTNGESRSACIDLVLSTVPTHRPREAFMNTKTMAIIFPDGLAVPVPGRHGTTRRRPVVDSRAVVDYLDGANLLEPPSVHDWSNIVEARLLFLLPYAVLHAISSEDESRPGA